jgi:hypothetical protein
MNTEVDRLGGREHNRLDSELESILGLALEPEPSMASKVEDVGLRIGIRTQEDDRAVTPSSTDLLENQNPRGRSMGKVGFEKVVDLRIGPRDLSMGSRS